MTKEIPKGAESGLRGVTLRFCGGQSRYLGATLVTSAVLYCCRPVTHVYE